MKIETLLQGVLTLKIRNNNPNLNINNISCNSKCIKGNCLFVAIKGNNIDGHHFIAEAVKKGAKAIMVEDVNYFNSIKNDAAAIYVDNSRRALAQIAANFYGHPSRKIKVIGITGTNGKTTVSYLLEKIFKEAGCRVGIIGTINYRLNGKTHSCINTTPDALTIQYYLNQMVKEKVDYAIMEVSSHALDQERVGAIKFSCAVFTNLTQDHLDYHKSLDNYFKAKSRLFTMLPSDSFAIINTDDPYAKKVASLTGANTLRFGLKDGDIKPKKIKLKAIGIEFYLTKYPYNILIRSHLVGMHNVYNILAATAAALSLNMDIQKIKRGIFRLKFVPGRLEPIEMGQPYKVFVDYAHTEDGLKKVLTSLNELYNKNRVICVFGCGGNRDKGKRPKMGRVASDLSSYVIITSDNPRTEEPRDIAYQVASGIKNKNFEIILDRSEAIRRSFLLADRNTVVLIAGKGHEKYQIIKDIRIPFDDKEVAKEVIKSLR